MRQFLQRPLGWIVAGGVALALIALLASAIYVFGAGGATTAPSATATTAPTLQPTANGTRFTLDASSSEASFTIDEVLFGKPNTVVGKTNQVTGQIVVNRQDPSQSQVGQIRVDLSTLATDNDLRNRTLQGRIFETSDSSNQYATFTPTSLSGLPSTIAIGQQVSFKMTGDLVIHHTTKSVTFDAQATLTSDTGLKGQAQTTVRYKDFGLNIPSVPSVAGVSDTVKLALTFTAHSA